jgi:hypothetical protein
MPRSLPLGPPTHAPLCEDLQCVAVHQPEQWRHKSCSLSQHNVSAGYVIGGARAAVTTAATTAATATTTAAAAAAAAAAATIAVIICERNGENVLAVRKASYFP